MNKEKKFTWWDRLLTSKLFLILMLLVGLLIFLYPILSDQYYAIRQRNQVQAYQDMMDKLPTREGRIILDQAIAYNEALSSTPSMYSSDREEVLRSLYERGQLPDFFHSGRLIGTLEIPKIDVQLPLFSGVTENELQQGAGWLPNTSLPVGGESTHSVLTAHRGLPQSRLFTDLNQLVAGDVFFVQVLDKPHAYEVDQIQVIDPTNTEALYIVPGQDYITLLTCHPYMINSHRLLVRGHRIPYTPQVQEKGWKEKKENCWALFFQRYKEYLIGILIFLLLLWWQDRRMKREKRGGGARDHEENE